MKVKTVNIDIKSRERTLLETVDGRVLSLEIENINTNDLLSQEDYENGFRAFFAPLTGMSRDEFTSVLEELGAQVIGMMHLQEDSVLIIAVPPAE